MNLAANITLFWQSWTQSPLATRLASVLLHFLWQGAALGTAAFLLLAALKQARPQVRYSALLTIFALMPLSVVVTWMVVRADSAAGARNVAVERMSIPTGSIQAAAQTVAPAARVEEEGRPPETPAVPDGRTSAHSGSEEGTSVAHRATRLLGAVSHSLMNGRPWVATAWLLGVSLFGLRLALGLFAKERLCHRGLMSAGESIEDMLSGLRERMGIRVTVRVFESCLAETPILVGWLAPVILLPASALSGLTPPQLKAILAHELAHVRRHDYFVNVVQSVVETLLFYHPAVWWISRAIRQERELCCDDVAIGLCGDRLAYAGALAALEEQRAAAPGWAVAARGGALSARIRRIVGLPEQVQTNRLSFLLVAAAMILILAHVARTDGALPAGVASVDAHQSSAEVPNGGQATVLKLLAGRIVDSKGSPVADARVYWISGAMFQKSPPTIATGHSDATGRFHVEVKVAPVTGRGVIEIEKLWVLAPGMELACVDPRPGIVGKGTTRDWILRLSPEQSLSLVVRDPHGQPLRRAIVESWMVRSEIGEGVVPEPFRERLRRTTDAAGRVALAGVANARLETIRITSDEFGAQEVRAGRKDFLSRGTITVSDAGRIEGRVLGTGLNSLRGLAVSVRSLIGPTDGVATVSTDDEGRFVIPKMAEGQLMVVLRRGTATVPESLLPRDPLTAFARAGKTSTVTIPLVQRVLVRGVVETDDTHAVVPGAEVAVIYGTTSLAEHVTTDQNGKFTARVLSGPVSVAAIVIPPPFRGKYLDAGQSGGSPQTDVPFGANGFELPPVLLTPLGSLRGRVVDRQFRTLAGAEVYANSHKRRYGLGRTNSAGAFSGPVPRTILVEQRQYEVWINDKGRRRACEVSVEHQDPLVLQVTQDREQFPKLDPSRPRDENLADAGTEVRRGASAAPLARRAYDFHVVNTRNKPIAGARVSVWAVGWKEGRRSGSFSVDDKLFPPTTSATDGVVKIVFPTQGEGKTMDLLRAAEKKELSEVALTVDHPDHPIWDYYINLDGKRRIMLSDPTKVVIRAHREHETGLLRHLYPVLAGAPFAPEVGDWSERDGVLTVSRLDLTGEHAFGLLRVAQFPEKGPPLFSDLVDLKKHVEDPITLDLVLKPGVRVEGKLDAQVPRPIKHGRVVAGIQTGHNDYGNNWQWDATATIAPDGTFVFDSLPSDENLQLIALCDGWVSRSPSRAEVMQYAEANTFGVHYPGPMDWAVSPRPYRLTGTAIQPVVPMRRAANCEVHVADEANKPLAGARVDFSPNQKWLNGGATYLGAAADYATVMRGQLASGVHTAKAHFDEFGKRFSVQTDARGIALVQNLPVLVTDETVTPHGTNFTVSCKGYQRTKKLLDRSTQSVSLLPGETANVTVHLKKE